MYYTDFSKLASCNFEDKAGVQGYMDGYSGNTPNFKQFKTNMERVSYKHGLKSGSEDKANGLSNLYIKDVPTQIKEILAPVGEAVIVVKPQYGLPNSYVVYINKEIINGDEDTVIRKCKQHVIFCRATQRDFEARQKALNDGSYWTKR